MSSPYEPVSVDPQSTSYFSAPEQELDPSLFDGNHLKPHVRDWILDTVTAFLNVHYRHGHLWSRVWIAGSGVSYQWSAARDPGDLDLMLGIDYAEFRRANPDFTGFSDTEIATEINQTAYRELYPLIDGVSFGASNFEVTLYANMGVSADVDGIKFINPYAAYDVTQDEWAVLPDPSPAVPMHPAWEMRIEDDKARGQKIVDMYLNAVQQIQQATNPAHRSNAEHNLNQILDAADSLYDEIHSGRKAAFSPYGQGYADFANYRWQAGKSTGVVHAMRRLRDYSKANRERSDFETYGMELPDTETLIRRAMSQYGSRR